jgi:hypothetical protein
VTRVTIPALIRAFFKTSCTPLIDNRLVALYRYCKLSYNCTNNTCINQCKTIEYRGLASVTYKYFRNTNMCRLSSVVEHFHGKEGVSGSNPEDGSILEFFIISNPTPWGCFLCRYAYCFAYTECTKRFINAMVTLRNVENNILHKSFGNPGVRFELLQPVGYRCSIIAILLGK